MKVGVLGTGIVGRTLVAKLADLNHQVMIGTRNVTTKLTDERQDSYGHPPFSTWYKGYAGVPLASFREAVAFSDLIINATSAYGTLEMLASIGPELLDGKVFLDLTNPLDFSQGMPPSLLVSNTDSLAEQIQRAYPNLRVVKALNTINVNLIVNPSLLGEQTDGFISGNDTQAKAVVIALMREFGWESLLDLGDITTARTTEMLLPLFVQLTGVLQTPIFNLKLVRQVI